MLSNTKLKSLSCKLEAYSIENAESIVETRVKSVDCSRI